MMILKLAGIVLAIIGIALLLGLSPSRITSDLLSLLTPKSSVRQDAIAIRKGARTDRSYRYLMTLRDALKIMGKDRSFAVILTAALVFFAVGVLLSVLLDNLFLLPVLAIAGGMIPFLYASRLVDSYKRHIGERLETTLLVITISYLRTNNIIAAVQDNEEYIMPPLKDIFAGFVNEATSVDSNIKRALIHLREKIDNEIFVDWVDTLIRCQDDRTLGDSLIPIVEKFSDVRIVNEELKTELESIRAEYYGMAAMLVGILPILRLINKDWFDTLLYTTPGKIVLALDAAVLLITFLIMRRRTRPIEYKR